jgi:hypothetical protein
MVRRALATFTLLFFAMSAAALADQGPSYHGPLSATEQSFVTSIQADLMARFPTAADAVKAGYVRYTGEDNTGAISYANRQWQSSDARHPSQLWYDKTGHLLGADYSSLVTGSERPSIFGVNPGRLYEFNDHVHYVLRDSAGNVSYDLYLYPDAYAANGGDPKHPKAADLVKLGKAKGVGDVVTVFDMPSIWDLIVWVKPNPSGAFADKNPNVVP